jgi:hypothetical protein
MHVGVLTERLLGITVPATPPQPGGITGTWTVPKGSSGFVYSIAEVAGATEYLWTVPSGAYILSGQGTSIYKC